MGIEQNLLSQQEKKQVNQLQVFDKQDQNGKQARLENPQQLQKNEKMRKIKFLITFLTIIFTSFQVYDITTVKLQHSRNFIRFLNYYLIDHTGFDIYWAGQYMLNYPINEYYQIEQVRDFLKKFQQTMQQLDDEVYGFMDFQDFLTRKNKIFIQLKNKQSQKQNTQQFDYRIVEGFTEPFTIESLSSIKDAILSSQQIQITLEPFNINEHIWNVMISITTYSQSSIIVQIYARQEISFWKEHLSTFLMGVVLLGLLIYQKVIDQNNKLVDNIPEYLLCIILINTFAFSFDTSLNVEWLVIIDGIQCFISWLLILKFLQKQDDYHISFLIRKSYALVGRLFISFGPIFIAFTIFGYTLFCREAWQFSTFKRTFLNLFYISYYNMTYESFIVTSRANPISMIFFFCFVILFTICVYSGMLVSVFCSYVWNKREQKIKKDIVNNLKIQCTQCDYKYKYVDCLKLMKQSKKSMKMSFIMQIDFKSSDQKYKYKKIIQKKISYLTEGAQKIFQINRKEIKKNKSSYLKSFYKENILEKIKRKLKFMIGQLIVTEKNCHIQQNENKTKKEENKNKRNENQHKKTE